MSMSVTDDNDRVDDNNDNGRKLILTIMAMIMGGRMKMNLKLSLAVTPSQAPTRPSAVVTWRERKLFDFLILTKWLIDLIIRMLVILTEKIKTSLSCRRPRVSASFSLACRSSVNDFKRKRR